MASVNKIILVGNLGRDPEMRSFPSGDQVANVTIATTDKWKDKQTGDMKEATEWHRVVIFNEGIAKVAEQYLKKGSSVYIEGSLQTRKWTDKDGIEKYTTEIVLQNFNGNLTMLGSKPGGGSGDSYGGGDDFGSSSPMERPRSSAKPASFARDLDDEVPF